MKILFASDLHGSPESLSILEKHIAELKPDQIALLGDLLYHGPRNPLPQDYAPPSASDLLNKYKDKIIAVRGNCDCEVDQMLLQFPMMADYSVILIDGRKFFLTHGHHWNPNNLPPLGTVDVLAFGHTHIPTLFKDNSGVTCFNPGSVTFPKQGFPPSFGFYENGCITIYNLNTMDVITDMTL